MYVKQIILLFSFVVLIFQISYLSSYKTEMEVIYKSKDKDSLPVISICTFYDCLKANCEHATDSMNKVARKSCKLEQRSNHLFINQTTKQLFEFEDRCAFLNEEHLIYIYNNTFHRASKISTYLNFGLFCKLYEFNESSLRNHNDGFFKINSSHDHKLTVFMHEKGTYPTDVNLKIYFSEFKSNQKSILIILELNKVIRSNGNLFSRPKQIEFNNTRDCFQNCFKSSNLSKYDFLYLKDESDYLILNHREKIAFRLLEERCRSKCHFGHMFESYFKIEKTTFNGDLIKNKTMTYQNWIIFYQTSRVVTFSFNDVITFKVYLIYLCNVVSLIFGFSFFSFFTNFVFYLKRFIKFRIQAINFKYSMILISILLAFLQAEEIVKEYREFLTTTDLKMNLVQITPNLTLSLCFKDILQKHAPDYDLTKNEFVSGTKFIDNQTKHLSNLSVQELVDIVDKISNFNDLFSLKIRISNKFKFVNTIKENIRIFFRNGRYCFRIDLGLDKFITKSKNEIKAMIESETYLLIVNNKDKFEFFFLTNYETYPSFGDETYLYENTFRISLETQPETSDPLHCENYTKHYNCATQETCIERCVIVDYFQKYRKLPIDLTYVPNDKFCQERLNLSNEELYFDTQVGTAMRTKLIKDACIKNYVKLDCRKYTFTSINIREKDETNLKLSLYFDRVNITHLNKMELISLINYLIGIFSLWLGFSFRIIVKFAKKILSKFIKLEAAKTFLNIFLLIGLIAHTYYISLSIIANSQVAITYFQPSKFILHPLFALCFELDSIHSDDFDKNFREITGNYLKSHTKNLSQLVDKIRFLDKNFEYKELNNSDLKNFEAKYDHLKKDNLKISFFFYYKYKCYEFKHEFESKELHFNFELDTVFLQFDLIDLEFELMFYADQNFGLENKIFIPAHSHTILRYIAIYTIPVNENLTFCQHNKDNRTNVLIKQTRNLLVHNEFHTLSTQLIPLTHNFFEYTIRDELFFNSIDQIEDRIHNEKIKPRKNCSIKYRNVALTQKNEFQTEPYRLEINPSFIDVIVEQKTKYSFTELIILFAGVPLFWLDFSLKDLLELLILARRTLRRKRTVHTFNQKNLEKIPKSSSFIVFNVGPNQDRIVFI